MSYHHPENKKGDVESIGLKTVENLKLCSNEYESKSNPQQWFL